MTEQIQKAADFIRKHQDFILISHISPDGDTLGSAIALSLGLKKISKTACVVCEDPVPRLLEFLPEADRVRQPEEVSGADAVISVDCADLARTGTAQSIFRSAAHTFCIDHHRTNTGFAEENCIIDCAATGELIVRILKLLDVEIDTDIATCLYTAISTDTGNFAYRGTTSDTFRMMADVLASGLDISELNQRLFRSEPFKKVKLRALAVNNAVLYHKDQVAVSTLTLKEMENLGCTAEDAEGLIDNLRDIDSVLACAILRESDKGNIRVSFRGKGQTDVSKVATHFGGGGHKLAAGCTLYMTMEEALKTIKKILPESLNG